MLLESKSEGISLLFGTSYVAWQMADRFLQLPRELGFLNLVEMARVHSTDKLAQDVKRIEREESELNQLVRVGRAAMPPTILRW